MRLAYHIEEGAQELVSNILVTGNDKTRPGVVTREVRLQVGQPLSQGAVVDSQRRLYDLGIFSRVLIAPQNPAGTDPSKTVGVLVEEARRYTFGYGLGFEAARLGPSGTNPVGSAFEFSPRGTLEFTKLNFTGRADSLSFKVRASTLQGRALLTYTSSNHFARPNLSLQVSGFYEKARDVLTFTSRRTEGSVQLTDKVSTTSFVSWCVTPTAASSPAICKSARKRFRCSASRRWFPWWVQAGCATAAIVPPIPRARHFQYR